MANPITPSGRPRRDSLDIFEAARNQDEERQVREDNQYFEQTGINRPPREIYDPLVDNNTQDVARDGDSYDDQPFRDPIVENYAEDAPSQIIDEGPRGRANSSRQHFERQRSLLSEAINASILREGIDPNIMARPSSTNARQAYLERQRIVENKINTEEERKTKEKVEVNKKKFINSITGLDI